MTLGDVFSEAARRDISNDGPGLHLKEGPFRYTEFLKNGKFEIRLTSTTDENAFIETSIPDDSLESTHNYCRVHFLSMVFKAAIAGMKRRKEKPNEAPAAWIARIFEFCQTKRISPIKLIQVYQKWEKSQKDSKNDE